MLDYYLDTLGADLVPLQKFVLEEASSKAPLLIGWSNTSFTKEELQQYLDDEHSIGYRMKATELVIDVEVFSEGGHTEDGRDSFKQLCVDCDIDLNGVPVVTSPQGGKHYYFRLPENTQVMVKHPSYPGIDFLSGGRQVVAAGCRHWRGGRYELDFMSQISGTVPPMATPALVSRIKRREIKRGDVDGGVLTPGQLEQCLEHVDVLDYNGDSDGWFNFMAACHHAAGDEAFSVFEEWCWGDPKYLRHPEIPIRWASLTDRSDGTTFGTLFKKVRESLDAAKAPADHPVRLLIENADAKGDFDPIPVKDQPPPPFKRAEIDVSFEQDNQVEEVFDALAVLGGCFVQDHKLVRVVREQCPPGWQENTEGSWTIRPVMEGTLRGLFAKCALFYTTKMVKDKNNEDGEVPINVRSRSIPGWLMTQALKRDSWHQMSPIKGIVQTPTMLQDGIVLQTPGFHKHSGILYKPSQLFEPVPENPTREDAQAALGELHEVVHDFPFVSAEHRSVWLSAVLTMFTRHAFKGPVPLYFFDGNTSGVGKSLLIDTVGYLTSGRQVAKMAYPPSDEEMDKRLTTVIRQGTAVQLFDNVPNHKVFGFPSLDAAVTSGVWESRVLGKTETTGAMDVKTLFAATGNNLKLGNEADATRRLAYCRIAFEGDDPSRRTGFLHENLPQWILDNRARLVKAVLTILKAYWAAGRPKQQMEAWGSFETWSEHVRAPLVWAGESDPIETHSAMIDQADESRFDYELIVHGFHEIAGDEPMSVEELIERSRSMTKDQCPNFKEALTTLFVDKKVGSEYNYKAIGKEFAKAADKNVNGLMLTKQKRRARRRWYVTPFKKADK